MTSNNDEAKMFYDDSPKEEWHFVMGMCEFPKSRHSEDSRELIKKHDKSTILFKLKFRMPSNLPLGEVCFKR